MKAKNSKDIDLGAAQERYEAERRALAAAQRAYERAQQTLDEAQERFTASRTSLELTARAVLGKA